MIHTYGRYLCFGLCPRQRSLFLLLLAFGLVLACLPCRDALANTKYASIIVDVNSGRVLSGARAYEARYPASLVKIMTIYMLFEALEDGKIKMSSKIYFSHRATSQPPTKLGIKQNDSITVKDAIRILVTKSANDVATAVAEFLGKSESRFAKMMTRKAHDLGMQRSQFRNASGLPNKRQKTTARDIATLVIALQRHFPQYYHFFALESFTYRGKTYKNHNKLLGKYPGVDGTKTGYIRASGFNLAVSVNRANARLVAVVFGGRTSKSRNAHMVKLLDKGLAIWRRSRFIKAPVPPKHLALTQNTNH